MSLPTATRFVHPDIVSSHFHFRNGDRVADFGAGGGSYLAAISKAVGNDGKVYACEIRKNLIERLGQLVRERSLPNVEIIWCDIEAERGTRLKDGVLDGGVCANLLFQLEEKADAVAEMARVLRRGGKLFVIDWKSSYGGLGPRPDHVLSESKVTALMEAEGLAYERKFPAGDHHYGLAFRKK